MLRSQRKEWQMEFASSGEEALEKAGEEPFDVIVTDMRMPGMDGAQLLTKFLEKHPRTLRFVLSGHSELEAVMRAVSIAHQFLSKPCDADTLKEVVERALNLRTLLEDERVQAIVGEMDSLPSRPETYAAIVSALADPEVEMPVVSDIIESDLAMSAKLLQIVNSSFFGLPQNMADVGQATSFLGLNVVRDLALSIEVFRPPPDAGPELERYLAGLQERSSWIAGTAKKMFQDKRRSSEAFTSGMLHDIGGLVLATQLPDLFAESVEMSRRSMQPLHVVEQELHGVSHAEVGAYLLGVWGLPYTIMEVAAYHHHPADLPHEEFGVLSAVHVASALIGARDVGSTGLPKECWQIDMGYLERIGVEDRMEEWETLVDEQLAGAESGVE